MTTTTTETPTTDEVLVGMLTENTGRHMLDSGGAYGRAWERNQGTTLEDWKNRQPAKLDKDGILTLDVFHFLRDRLDYDPDMQEVFDEYAELPENRDEGWLTLMEGFAPWVRDNRPDLLTGRHDVDSMTVNTYNNEDALSQTIQYTAFTLGDHGEAIYGEFVLLQIHGGCDVRGGYTAPKVFRASGMDGAVDLFDNAGGELWCDRSDIDPNQPSIPGLPERDTQPHYWRTHNAGYTWDNEGFIDGLEDIKDLSSLWDEDAECFRCPVCDSPLSAGEPVCG